MVPEIILEKLTRISNEQTTIAMLWHLAVAGAMLALALGWRPSRRIAALALAAPVVSVSSLAWAYGNPFNGATHLVLAVVLLGLGVGLPKVSAAPGPLWSTALGIAMVVFGLVYPHFLRDAPWTLYLIAAPVGLVPCPTLSLIIGFSLIADGFESRLWSVTLGVTGLFYGVFGVFRLGVTIDVALILGAAALIVQGFRKRAEPLPSDIVKSASAGVG